MLNPGFATGMVVIAEGKVIGDGNRLAIKN